MQLASDPISERFVRIMEIFAFIGMVGMMVAGIAYFVGPSRFVPIEAVVQYWDRPAREFWTLIGESEPGGYACFLKHLNYADSLSILGVLFLMLTPMLSILAAIPKSRGIHMILFLILVFEFVVAMLRPLYLYAIHSCGLEFPWQKLLGLFDRLVFAGAQIESIIRRTEFVRKEADLHHAICCSTQCLREVLPKVTHADIPCAARPSDAQPAGGLIALTYHRPAQRRLVATKTHTSLHPRSCIHK